MKGGWEVWGREGWREVAIRSSSERGCRLRLGKYVDETRVTSSE